MRFSNNPACPFSAGCVADSEIKNVTLPSDIATNTEDAVEYAHNEISIEVDYSSLNFVKVPVPSIARKTKNKVQHIYEKIQTTAEGRKTKKLNWRYWRRNSSNFRKEQIDTIRQTRFSRKS